MLLGRTVAAARGTHRPLVPRLDRDALRVDRIATPPPWPAGEGVAPHRWCSHGAGEGRTLWPWQHASG